MPTQSWFCRLLPPRATFAQDMSPAEAKAMQDHGVYWRQCMAKGNVVVFGLVADPAAAYGIAVLEVADLNEARQMTDNDPAIRAGLGLRYDIQPMPFGAVHPPHGT